MNKRFMNGSLLVFCCAATLLTGCFPDNSLIWSSDGSVGLFRAAGKLFVVDGATGQLKPIRPEGGVSLMPGISADGNRIAYVAGTPCTTVQEGLELFPPFMAETIRRDAKQLARKVTAGLIQPIALMPGKDNPLGFSEAYHRWVVRAMCENPDETVVACLGPDRLAECRGCEIGYTRLIVAPRANPEETTELVTMPMTMFRPRFSPDGRHVAYIVPELHDDDKATLYVASTDGKTSAAEVAAGVAVNYDWRPDGRALAYVKQDSDALLGVLEEKIVVDEAGALQAELSANAATAPVGIQRFADQGRQLVGTLYQPFTKVQYGNAGRLFFSSPAVKIPTSSLEQPTYSLFCYDAITGTVVDVLPASVAALTGDMVNFFALSPDGTKVLLPMSNQRLAIYTLGDKTPVVPIDEDEEFGEDVPDMLPSWKSNTEISCLVSSNSRFLGDSAQGQEDRHEIVVLNADGSFQAHLSADWPDDVMP
jgi:hypothetical protein